MVDPRGACRARARARGRRVLRRERARRSPATARGAEFRRPRARGRSGSGFGRAVPRPATARAHLTADPRADARTDIRADAFAGSEAQSAAGSRSEADTGARRRCPSRHRRPHRRRLPRKRPRPPRRRRHRSRRGERRGPLLPRTARAAGASSRERRARGASCAGRTCRLAPRGERRAPPGYARWASARPGCWSRALSASARMKLIGGSAPTRRRGAPARLRVGQRATLVGLGIRLRSGRPDGDLRRPRGEACCRPRRSGSRWRFPRRSRRPAPRAACPSWCGRTAASPAVVDVAVFQGPRLHGISPGAAMPGEEVMLAGAGWGIGATVRFGSAPAQILEVQPTQIRALVPEVPGGPGSERAVVVTIGGVDSNPAPFILGHLPVVSGLNPASAGPGDVVTVSGKGFETIAGAQRGARGRRCGARDRRCRRLAAGRRAAPRSGGEPRAPSSCGCPASSNVGQALLAAQAGGGHRRVPLHRRAVRSRRRPRARAARDGARAGLRAGRFGRTDGRRACGGRGRAAERRGAAAAHDGWASRSRRAGSSRAR